MRNLVLVFVLFFSIACDGTDNTQVEEDEFHQVMKESFADDLTFEEISIPTTQQPIVDQKADQNEITQKVIKSGVIEFQSKDIEKDYQLILQLVNKADAYIEHENQSRSAYRINYDLTIRVSANRYDSVYRSLTKLAFRLDRKTSNIQDVTERYYDLKSRIKNKQILEQRYLNLLDQAKTMSDILEIEEKLNNVRTEVEKLQGQFRYLSKQISYSTINLSFYEELPYTPESRQKKGFGLRILEALSRGWQGLLYLIIGLTSVWPFLLIMAVSIFGIKWYRNNHKAKNIE